MMKKTRSWAPAAILFALAIATRIEASDRVADQGSFLGACSPALRVTTSDTLWFGGTHWEIAESRWVANVSLSRSNAWTFDSGVDGNREGWTSRDLSAIPLPTVPAGNPDGADFRWVDQAKYDLYGTPGTDLFPGSTDNGAIWCGKFEPEANELCWGDGQGYGNNWDHEARKSFAYGGTGDVRVTYRYFSDLEPLWDYAYLYLEFDGAREASPRVIHTNIAGSPSSKRTKTLTVSSSQVPQGTAAITVVFHFQSDSGTSDEDWTRNTRYSGFCCYNFLYEDLGTTGNNDQDTFESGPEGWGFFQKTPIGSVMDVTPLAELPEPAVPCSGTVLQGNVVTLFDKNAGPGAPLHPRRQDEIATSPRIDLAAAGALSCATKLLVADFYADLPAGDAIYLVPRLRIYPYACPTTGQLIEQDVPTNIFLHRRSFAPPTCGDEVVLADFSSFSVDVQYCYVSLEVIDMCYACAAGRGNTTPWFDNVRLAVTQDVVDVATDPKNSPAVPLLTVHPNPFARETRFAYSVVRPGPVRLRMFDVRGALVTTLVDDPRSPGLYHAVWNGTRDDGGLVGSGVFWVRYDSGGQVTSSRVVVFR
jgi:hypothetical protein